MARWNEILAGIFSGMAGDPWAVPRMKMLRERHNLENLYNTVRMQNLQRQMQLQEEEAGARKEERERLKRPLSEFVSPEMGTALFPTEPGAEGLPVPSQIPTGKYKFNLPAGATLKDLATLAPARQMLEDMGAISKPQPTRIIRGKPGETVWSMSSAGKLEELAKIPGVKEPEKEKVVDYVDEEGNIHKVLESDLIQSLKGKKKPLLAPGEIRETEVQEGETLEAEIKEKKLPFPSIKGGKKEKKKVTPHVSYITDKEGNVRRVLTDKETGKTIGTENLGPIGKPQTSELSDFLIDQRKREEDEKKTKEVNTILFGDITKPGAWRSALLPASFIMNPSTPLTEDEKKQVRAKFEMKRKTMNPEIAKRVEEYLNGIGITGAQVSPEYEKELEMAREAIKQGKPKDKVKELFKQRTGQDFPE